MKEIDLYLNSVRNTEIPVSIIDAEKENAPLVLFVHGFKADRHEGGRFTEMGRRLAQCGVSSIRMGFPGCDESKEDFIHYTMRNCLCDIETCYTYMKENYSLDLKRVGMVGYSMGGRLTSVFIGRHPEISVIALWAGACYKGYGNDDYFLGGDLRKMKAQTLKDGYADFLNVFDNTMLRLNKELFDDMETLDPVQGLNDFKGAAIVVQGDHDITVLPEVSEKSYEELKSASQKKLVIVKNADHGFGLWDDHPEQSEELVNNTTEFFKENL